MPRPLATPRHHRQPHLARLVQTSGPHAAALAHAKEAGDDAAHRRLMLRKLFAWAGSLACDDRVADVVLCAGPAASTTAWRARPPTDAEFRGSLSGWIQ